MARNKSAAELSKEEKQELIWMVETERAGGAKLPAALKTAGISNYSYYAWQKPIEMRKRKTKTSGGTKRKHTRRAEKVPAATFNLNDIPAPANDNITVLVIQGSAAQVMANASSFLNN